MVSVVSIETDPRSLASILETFEALSSEQWEMPILSGHWIVRHVLEHLMIAAARPRGRFAVELAKGVRFLAEHLGVLHLRSRSRVARRTAPRSSATTM